MAENRADDWVRPGAGRRDLPAGNRPNACDVQPYLDSEFPHGTDQFISAAATNWATMALIAGAR